LHASSVPPPVVVLAVAPPVPPPVVVLPLLVELEVLPPPPVVSVVLELVLLLVLVVPVVVLALPLVLDVVVLGPFVAALVSLPPDGSLHAAPSKVAVATIENCIEFGTRIRKRMTVNVRSKGQLTHVHWSVGHGRSAQVLRDDDAARSSIPRRTEGSRPAIQRHKKKQERKRKDRF